MRLKGKHETSLTKGGRLNLVNPDFYDDDENIEDMTKYDLCADDNGENHRRARESDPTP